MREPYEHQARSIAQARLIPLGELAKRLSEIDPSRPVVVHCKSGMRSAKACALLRERGFRQVANMSGGIDAWR